MKTNFHQNFKDLNPNYVKHMRERIDQCKTVWMFEIKNNILDKLKEESKKDFTTWLKGGNNLTFSELQSIAQDLKKDKVMNNIIDIDLITQINKT